MDKQPSATMAYVAPLVVILLLIGACFAASRNPYIPRQSSGDSIELQYVGQPQVDVWVSRDRFFAWNKEPLRPLEELPARIRDYRNRHHLKFASVSGDDLTRFEQTVYVLDQLRKGGFRTVTVDTRVKPEPDQG